MFLLFSVLIGYFFCHWLFVLSKVSFSPDDESSTSIGDSISRIYVGRSGNSNATVLQMIHPLQELKIPQNETQPKNKTLVLLTGTVRGGEPTWNSLYKHLLDYNSADLAMVIQQSNDHSSSLYDRARYIWEIPNFNDWADAFDLIPGIAKDWRNRTLPYNGGDYGILFGGAAGRNATGAVVMMNRWFAANAIRAHGLQDKYDRFVVTRTDHFYACDTKLHSLRLRSIWIPHGENHRGLNDRWFLCPKHHLLSALDMLPPLLRDPERYTSQDWFYSSNTEIFLRKRWREENLTDSIKRFKRTMFLAKTPSDYSSWTRDDIFVPTRYGPGVLKKYPMEYDAAICNCDGNRFASDPNKPSQSMCINKTKQGGDT